MSWQAGAMWLYTAHSAVGAAPAGGAPGGPRGARGGGDWRGGRGGKGRRKGGTIPPRPGEPRPGAVAPAGRAVEQRWRKPPQAPMIGGLGVDNLPPATLLLYLFHDGDNEKNRGWRQ